MATARCRVCLQTESKQVSFYAGILLDGKVFQVRKLVKYCCNLEISDNDGKPQWICEKCLVEGVTCYKFLYRIRESDKILENEMNEKLNNFPQNEVNITEEEVDIKVECPDSDSDLDLKDPDYDNSICNEDPDDYAFEPEATNSNHNDEDTQTIKKRYMCLQCGKKFFYKLHLKIHAQTHTASNKCDTCGLGFASVSSLNEHKRLHVITDKPYKCPECHKPYKHYSSLKFHMEGHKRYTCMECLQGFKHESHLLTHTLAEHGVACTVCSTRVKDSIELANHMHSHTNR
ncbi:PREDICTED: zinc finger protein 852-like [Nicrophorus vespilloides]|uniref:Zinc finger protein 852-like n=1 Tax=Nicrophorus vespilloides TaxID=110193 RepID=A0ABM1M3W6_NICVS|nr:PREDICTED: zinc finger protein 852-like [Nicrophorus vespilloides]